MPLMTVNVNGKKFVVDAPNRNVAKAFGRRQIEVKVEDATAADVASYYAAGNIIEVLTAGEAAAAAAASEPAKVEAEEPAPLKKAA